MAAFENGDLIQLEKSLQEDYDGTIGTLAKDSLRNLKNLGIVLVTLASRAAIRRRPLSGNFLFSERFLHPTD